MAFTVSNYEGDGRVKTCSVAMKYTDKQLDRMKRLGLTKEQYEARLTAARSRGAARRAKSSNTESLPKKTLVPDRGPAREFGSIGDREIRDEISTWYGNLDRAALSQANSYLSGGGPINSALRGLDTDPSKGVRAMMGDMETFFNEHAIPMPQDTIVRRGVYNLGGFDPEAIFAPLAEQSGYFVEAGWSSTTTMESMMSSQFRGQWQYEIRVPKGSRFVYGAEGQGEIVLPRNSRFRITGFDSEQKLVHMELEL